MTAKKKKVELTEACKACKHVFIVTASITKGGHQKASMMRCQHCLASLDMGEFESQEWNKENGINE